MLYSIRHVSMMVWASMIDGGLMGAAENRLTHGDWTAYEDRHDLSHAEEYLHDDIFINQSGPSPSDPANISVPIGYGYHNHLVRITSDVELVSRR
jgi:hypothetical protein